MRALRAVVIALVGVLIVGGAGVSVYALLWPEEAERLYGEVQTAVRELQTEVTGHSAEVVLGRAGGVRTLDQCDGTFTEMRSYRRGGIPPVWAAHNTCGGDVILPVRVGDLVNVWRGRESQLYRVVDVRKTPKLWVTTDELRGLRGDLVLQSCYYGGSHRPMKFVGLEPVRSSAP